MRKLLLPGLVVLVAFSLAAAGSWLTLKPKKAAPEEMAEKGHEAGAKGAKHGKEGGKAAGGRAGANKGGSQESAGDMSGGAAVDPSVGRISFRTEPMGGADVTVQFAANLRTREQQLKNLQSKIDDRRRQLDLVMNDLSEQRSGMDDLRKQIAAEMTALDEKVRAVEQQHSQLTQERSAMEKTQTVVKQEEARNVKLGASWFDKMEPEAAALIVKHMADSGEMETAVSYLESMTEKRVAQLLAALNDATLATQVFEKLKGIRKPKEEKK